MQLILIMYTPHICKFTYSLKLVCNPKLNAHGTCVAISGHAQSDAKFELANVRVPS